MAMIRRFALCSLFLVMGCETKNYYQQPPSQDADMSRQTFFDKYGATELGTTKIVDAAGLAILGQRGQPQKMIDISVDDAGACPVIVSIRTEYTVTPTTVDPGTGLVTQGISAIGGPVVGLIQWGTGGGENQVEVDVPTPRLPDNLAPLGSADGGTRPVTNLGNGVQVYLGAASHVSVYVRNDGSLSSLTDTNNRGALGPDDRIGSPTPVKVIVHIQPATSSGGPAIERTIWVAGGVLGMAASSLTPGNATIASIPPFAKNVRVQRVPDGQPVTLNFRNNFGIVYRSIDLGPNDDGPVDFDSNTDSINFINTGAANITQLQAVFEVTPA